MRVGDLIGSRKEVYTVSEETSVHEVAQYLRAKEVRTVGVLGANGKLTGVISQSDISDKVAAENKCPAWMKASDIMTRELVTVTAEKTLDECLLLMEQNGIFHLIVRHPVFWFAISLCLVAAADPRRAPTIRVRS